MHNNTWPEKIIFNCIVRNIKLINLYGNSILDDIKLRLVKLFITSLAICNYFNIFTIVNKIINRIKTKAVLVITMLASHKAFANESRASLLGLCRAQLKVV